MTEAEIARAIHRELQGLIGQLIEIGIVDDQNFAAIHSGTAGAWSVTQQGASLNLSLKKRPYKDVYLDLLGAHSFSMLLLDGAIMQYSYEGVGEQILCHRLAYLPSPTLEPYQNDPDLYLREYHFVDIVGHQVVPVPIRFDYDARAGVAVDVVHPVSHLTLGQYQHCRVPITRPASPREFTEFILNSFYSTPDMPRLSLRSHVSGLPATISAAEQTLTHLALP